MTTRTDGATIADRFQTTDRDDYILVGGNGLTGSGYHTNSGPTFCWTGRWGTPSDHLAITMTVTPHPHD